ncbi:MAG: hypothetical protein V1720_03500 [bacterium]
MKDKIVYEDSLLELTDDKIVLKNYYFPSLKPKEISIHSIDKVEMKEPSIRTGKYRYHGTGDFQKWYPLDTARSKRDKIFFLFLKDKWIRIGFTAENSEPVEKYFKEKGFLSS